MRMRVLSGSGVGSGRFFEALVVVEEVGGAACSTMLAQDFCAGWGIGVAVVGDVSWSSLVRIRLKVCSCLVNLVSMACGIGAGEVGARGAASGM